MDNREEQFGTNDIGLVLFVIVSGWLLVSYSGIF
jgi:hypothetical protein